MGSPGCSKESRSSSEMSGRLAISASARGMAEDSSSSRQMKKTTKTYVMKTDSQGNVNTHTDVQVSGSGSSESASMRRYEEQIRVLQEDLESEMTLRRRDSRCRSSLCPSVSLKPSLALSLSWTSTGRG